MICPKCRRIALSGHQCPPAWEVATEVEYEEGEWTTVYAGDEDTAAAQHIQDYHRFNSDYETGQSVVYVRQPDGSAKRYSVRCYLDPVYEAYAEDAP